MSANHHPTDKRVRLSDELCGANHGEITMPADYSFAAVNDYVYGVEAHFEELQALCLGMAIHIEKIQCDAERYQWLKNRLLGADFDWNNSGACTLVFELPKNSSVFSSCDITIDYARKNQAA